MWRRVAGVFGLLMVPALLAAQQICTVVGQGQDGKTTLVACHQPDSVVVTDTVTVHDTVQTVKTDTLIRHDTTFTTVTIHDTTVVTVTLHDTCLLYTSPSPRDA